MNPLSLKTVLRVFCILALCLGYTAPAASLEPDDNKIARCKGHGKINFQGAGTVSVSGDGILVVRTGIDNATVEVTFDRGILADDNQTDAAPPDCLLTDDGGCVYIGIDGKAQITGDSLDVTFAGANIGLTAYGDATLVIKGYGIYRVGALLGAWAIDGTIIVLEN